MNKKPTVAIHPPKTPVTTGSLSRATATLPNVCKMPGPPAPSVPVPLPNTGRSELNPQGFSKRVFIDGHRVAIQGATFGSEGDAASKASGGGLVSSVAEGETRFISPGSMSVLIEGKSVHLLGDCTLNNGAPGGPANAATLAGIIHDDLVLEAEGQDVLEEVVELCQVKCACQSGGGGQECMWQTMWMRDAMSDYTIPIKAEVPFDMTPESGGPPAPYMSANERRRATRQWWMAGHRRPDFVVVHSPNADPVGANIKAVVECKLGNHGWGDGQWDAYKEINNDKSPIEINDRNCECDSRPDWEPVLVPRPEKEEQRESPPDAPPDPTPTWKWAEVTMAAAAAAGAAVTAPVWVPPAYAFLAAAFPVMAPAAAAAVVWSLLASPTGAPGNTQ